MTAPQPQAGILDIIPYKGGESKIAGVNRVIKLSSNESPLGPSPKAAAAYRAVAERLHRYPDGGSTELRHAIGAAHGLDPERIVCGNGSDDLISLLAQAYAGQGDEVLYSAHGFLMYPIAARAQGATPIAAPETDFRADIDQLLARVSERTRILFLANPNNPTGTYLPAKDVARLRAALPETVLLVIDAAYAEYVANDDYRPGIDLVDAGKNTVMTRTFSKIYGLAALRVGWAYGPEAVIAVLNRIRGAFNVNAAAAAAAVAALSDRPHLEAAQRHNARWLPWLTQEVEKLGLRVVPSAGNFILIRFSSADAASKVDAALQRRGVILRAMGAYGLPECLRATVGTEVENRLLVEALKDGPR
jgi:histidinol-phosphate aminotransferase